MKILSIAIKDLIINLKDRKALTLIILMPLALIFVLGFTLSSLFQQGGVSIKKFDAAIVDKDGGEQSKRFKEFLSSDDIKEMVNLKETSEEEGMNKVKSGEIPVLIVIPEGYTEGIKSGEKVEIKMYSDPGSPLSSKIAESLVKSYTGVSSAVTAALGASEEVMMGYGLQGHMLLNEITEVFSSEDNAAEKAETKVLDKKEPLSAIQYYSAGMLVMYILFVGMLGTKSIVEEREQKTLQRLMTTSTSNTVILSGKLLGLLLLGIVDVVVLILFTRLAFNVRWGNSIPGLVLLSLTMVFAASGLSMFIATICRTSKAVDSINPIIIIILSFLGGSMFPIMIMPPILQTIGKIALNNWALRGYLNLMLNNGIASVVTPSIVLTVMGLIFLTLGISRLKLQ